MTEAEPKMLKRWHKILLGTLAGLTLITLAAALASPPPEEAAKTKTANAKAKATPAKRTFKQYLDDGGVDDLKSAKCFDTRACEIVITSNAGDKDGLVWDTRDAQRVAWDKKPKPKSVLVEIESDIVSVGGKERRGIVIGVLCDRAAADQIEWKNVLPEGIETLCTVSPRVQLAE